MLKPKKIEINGKEFIISKIPAFDCATLIPDFIKLTFSENVLTDPEAIALRKQKLLEILSYAAIEIDGQPIRLATKSLVDNHVDGFDMINKLIDEIFIYNKEFEKKESISA